MVGADYTPLQNHEAFEFFDPIVGKGAAIYHTAGALGKGERVWVLAKLPSDIHVVGDDIAEKFLLLSNSHDGSSSVQIKFTPIRVVCQNTLTMALSYGRTLRVPHRKDLHERLRDAERSLGIIHKRFDELEHTFQSMAQVQINQRKLDEYLSLVFPNPQDPENRRTFESAERNREAASTLFDEGFGNRLPGAAGTLWAAYNGVTQLVDHRATRQTPDSRLTSIWFGDGYLVKARAFQIADLKLKAWMN